MVVCEFEEGCMLLTTWVGVFFVGVEVVLLMRRWES